MRSRRERLERALRPPAPDRPGRAGRPASAPAGPPRYAEGDAERAYAVFTPTPAQRTTYTAACYGYAVALLLLFPGPLGLALWLSAGTLLAAGRVRGQVELRAAGLVVRTASRRSKIPWHEVGTVEVTEGWTGRHVVVRPYRARARVLPAPYDGPTALLRDPRFTDRLEALRAAAQAARPDRTGRLDG